MPVYTNNILPSYTSWTTNGTVNADGSLTGQLGTYVIWQFNTKNYRTGDYALVSCPGCVGTWFFYIAYRDTETSKWKTEAIRIPNEGIVLPIVLPEATTDALIFTIKSKSSGSIQPMSLQLVEQAISSVDIEYASGPSKVNPPEDGWQTTPPEWQTDMYIWQRTATTFADNHTEYSPAILIQNLSSAAIYEIEEQYYLSSSGTEAKDGEWVTTQPTWESGKYLWTRSKITWTDGEITYSDGTVSKMLNEANERAEEALTATTELDESLDADGVFNRLTDNGARQGIFIEDNNYYINASYISAGELIVATDPTKPNTTLFKASLNDNSVYIAGFTVGRHSDGKGYFGYNCTTFNYPYETGIYIGTDGISTSNGIKSIGFDNAYIIGKTRNPTETILGGITFEYGNGILLFSDYGVTFDANVQIRAADPWGIMPSSTNTYIWSGKTSNFLVPKGLVVSKQTINGLKVVTDVSIYGTMARFMKGVLVTELSIDDFENL